MTTHETNKPQVINDRLFEPLEARLLVPGEGAIGISQTACRILADLAATPGAPVDSASLAQSATPHASPDDAEISRTIAELNRLLGRLPSGALAIELSEGAAYALAPAAIENQPPPNDPRYGPKPFHKRPATWGSVIAIILALATLALAVSYSTGG